MSLIIKEYLDIKMQSSIENDVISLFPPPEESIFFNVVKKEHDELQVVQARASIVSAHLKHSEQSPAFKNFSHDSFEMTFLLSFNQNSRSLIKYSISGYGLVYH